MIMQFAHIYQTKTRLNFLFCYVRTKKDLSVLIIYEDQ